MKLLLLIFLEMGIFFSFSVKAQNQTNADNPTSTNLEVKVLTAELDCRLNSNKTEDSKNEFFLRILLSHPVNQHSKDEELLKVYTSFKSIDKYILVNLKDGKNLVMKLFGEFGRFGNAVEFSISEKISPSDEFGLIVNGKKLEKGKSASNTTFTRVKSLGNCETVAEKLPDLPDEKPPMNSDVATILSKRSKPVEKKENAEIQFNIALNELAGEDNGYFDFGLKLKPIRISKLGMGGYYEWAPLAVQWNHVGNPSSAKDEIFIGTELSHMKVFDYEGRSLALNKEETKKEYPWFRVLGISTTFFPRLETNYKFDQANLLFDWRSGPLINVFQNKTTQIRFLPFGGFEFGGSLWKKETQKKGILLMRPKFGGELQIVPFHLFKKNTVLFQASYTRYLFLKEEDFYTKNSDGNEVLEYTGRSPKDYVTAKISYNYKSLFSPFIEYEYGRKPPKYFEVDSRFKVGLEFNFDFNSNLKF